MHVIDSGRVTRRYTQTISAPPERVFPLLCPVREGEWLDGWAEKCRMIYSDSGLAEDGGVFVTTEPEQPDTVWMITRHDPADRSVEFVRVTGGILATRLGIRVAPGAEGTSRVDVAYTFTPLGADGAALVEERHSEASFLRGMAWWERSMNHWLRTGEILKTGGDPRDTSCHGTES